VEARKLIEGAALEPEARKAVGQAFDEARCSIEGRVGFDQTVVRGARSKLTTALLSWESRSCPAAWLWQLPSGIG
jgi:hypothetical protein